MPKANALPRQAALAIAFGLSHNGLITALALGQDSQTVPAFQAADVRASAPTRDPSMQGGVLRAGRFEIRRATMIDLIKTAYGVDPDLVLGGPSWLEWDRFDVIAKAPVDTPPAMVELMLQTLLVDRFKLAVHKDTESVQGFLLTVGNGKAKLKEADGSGETGCHASGQRTNWVATCRNVSMEAFAAALHGLDGRYITGPVTDQTALPGAWDFDLKWTDKRALPDSGDDGVTLFYAVDRQLGLRCRHRPAGDGCRETNSHWWRRPRDLVECLQDTAEPTAPDRQSPRAGNHPENKQSR